MPIFFLGYRTFSHAAPAERLPTVSSPFMVYDKALPTNPPNDGRVKTLIPCLASNFCCFCFIGHHPYNQFPVKKQHR